MRRAVTSHNSQLCDLAPKGRGFEGVSANGDRDRSSAVPNFVAEAIALNVPEASAWALYKKVRDAGKAVRTRKLTPAGGRLRTDRLASAVEFQKPAEGVS